MLSDMSYPNFDRLNFSNTMKSVPGLDFFLGVGLNGGSGQVAKGPMHIQGLGCGPDRDMRGCDEKRD